MTQQRYHFIVADDDKQARFLIEQTIRLAYPGATISSFEDGLEALNNYTEDGADVVITDYSMPHMHGAQLIRELHARNPALPVVMVSNSPDAREEGRAAGVKNFINKEDVLDRLPKVLNALLDREAA